MDMLVNDKSILLNAVSKHLYTENQLQTVKRKNKRTKYEPYSTRRPTLKLFNQQLNNTLQSIYTQVETSARQFIKYVPLRIALQEKDTRTSTIYVSHTTAIQGDNQNSPKSIGKQVFRRSPGSQDELQMGSRSVCVAQEIVPLNAETGETALEYSRIHLLRCLHEIKKLEISLLSKESKIYKLKNFSQTNSKEQQNCIKMTEFEKKMSNLEIVLRSAQKNYQTRRPLDEKKKKIVHFKNCLCTCDFSSEEKQVYKEISFCDHQSEIHVEGMCHNHIICGDICHNMSGHDHWIMGNQLISLDGIRVSSQIYLNGFSSDLTIQANGVSSKTKIYLKGIFLWPNIKLEGSGVQVKIFIDGIFYKPNIILTGIGCRVDIEVKGIFEKPSIDNKGLHCSSKIKVTGILKM
ncbi:uncharacterized protein LOC127719784 [Mytilus californianus]|uniref:uncharacterized protein LOC127719784 n=1 Tax=Mytilus californianus TaxID=6549 RepID=UPI0022454F70|nr:uncharacterized protein LOC127719784 [Mytilus californianus]